MAATVLLSIMLIVWPLDHLLLNWNYLELLVDFATAGYSGFADFLDSWLARFLDL